MDTRDTRAPAKEAGGIVTDISGKVIDFHLYEDAATQNFTAVAASSQIHEQLFEKVLN